MAIVRQTYPIASWIDPKTGIGGGFAAPRYAIGGNLAKRFFAPVHWIDRRMRPHIWRTLEWFDMP